MTCTIWAEHQRIQRRKIEGGYFRCLACKKDFIVRTGTLFERSHIPLNNWLFAMYLIFTARKGIFCLLLSKEIGMVSDAANPRAMWQE